VKMRLPKKFRALDKVERVYEVKGLIQRHGKYAQLNFGDHWIKIDAGLSAQEKVSSFMHELIEWALIVLGCEIKRPNEGSQFLLTHKELDVFAQVIRQAIETME